MSEPDDLDDYIAVEGLAPEVEAIGNRIFTEPVAPSGQRCDEILHVGPTGVWRCQRLIAHDGACFARGAVEVPDDSPLAKWLA